MLLPACDNGVVTLMLLTETDGGGALDAAARAGTGAGGAGALGGSGGRAGDRSAEARAGAGGQRVPFTLCDASWEPEAEAALREAFNDALSDGRFCPRESAGLRRPLVEDPDLQGQAHAAICYAPPVRGSGQTALVGGNWGQLLPSTTMLWRLWGTSSLEEAKNALLDEEDRSVLCEAAKETTYRAIGVGHVGGSWSVIISPALPEDTRRDDMQNP